MTDTTTGQTSADTSTGQQDQQQTGQDTGQQDQQLGPDGQPWDPDRAARLIENLRAEVADLKRKRSSGSGSGGQQQGQGQAPTQQQSNQQGQQPQQQAGQEPADDATADQLRAAQTELAVYRNAARHGADPTRLADSRSFMAAIGALDPTADDYDKQVSDAIKKAVEDHPHYRSGQAPATPRGGSDGTGRPGAPARPRGLDGAVSAHYAKQK